ncbi:hypothetical protein BOTCAL_0918g00010 [Botryotinia calthae]|uniref:FAD-binding domain-containing protein n=1 Tax=Botryotinia calthae TaxID=38488 RepID=A0A4Y8CEY0_9HELO|nr:hypothetical protein BOTCAL_0918g00010 [Botryotinia calthae]
MSVPDRCTVLVVGGGPGGSYAAAVLAREGIDTVMLEANVFPRYHIGESMLPSLRNYLGFIDLDSTFDSYGFTKKTGAAFRLSPERREGFTDFVGTGGPQNYSWNVVRSEADNLMFRHAGKCGANIFDGVKVDSINFAPWASESELSLAKDAAGAGATSLGRSVFAKYTHKIDDVSGVITFDYIIDASGRSGLLNTKYLKNRSYNQQLKNVAIWGYWEGAGEYGAGTKRANSPYFEALQDESGWAWFIPLHDGTTSVGIAMQEQFAKEMKAAIKLAPDVSKLLDSGKLISELRSASDYSYNSSSYAIPYARVVGDAGCFIDPFFSSGVHIAITGGLSAATSICAAIRQDCLEQIAAQWHSNKIREAYARFLFVVLGAYKQMRNQKEFVLSDFGEDNFDPIQGAADATNKITQAEFAKTVAFLSRSVEQKFSAARDDEVFLDEAILNQFRQNQIQSAKTMNDFTTDIIDGRAPRLVKGSLGLIDLNV